MPLKLDVNTQAPDEIYQALIDMHAGLDAQQSARVNARLILLLASHIGDPAVILEAARIARAGAASGGTPTQKPPQVR